MATHGRGFTPIDAVLVVVIVAVSIPRFVDLGSAIRRASVSGPAEPLAAWVVYTTWTRSPVQWRLGSRT